MSIRRLRGRSWGPKLRATISCLPLVMTAGCAGTPWGESLSSSFPTPPGQVPALAGPAEEREPTQAKTPMGQAPASAPAPVADGVAQSSQRRPSDTPVPPEPGSPALKPAGAKGQASPGRQPPVPKAKASPPTGLATPYRVTIRLPQADPSAPAEGVTQALRTAGIPFEVETIERVKGAAPAPLAEGPQGAAAATPSVRPAPPPR